MSDYDFNKTQQACEIALAHVDHLIEQGNPRSKALDHAVHRFGCSRAALARLLNERDYGLTGNSGETSYGVVQHFSGVQS